MRCKMLHSEVVLLQVVVHCATYCTRIAVHIVIQSINIRLMTDMSKCKPTYHRKPQDYRQPIKIHTFQR